MSDAVDLSGKGGSLIQRDEAPDFLAPPRVTVLGVGNVLLSDEGFGVRVAETLDAAYDFPDDVQVLDGGVLGMELLRFVTGTEKLLILDALKEGGADGIAAINTIKSITGVNLHTFVSEPSVH